MKFIIFQLVASVLLLPVIPMSVSAATYTANFNSSTLDPLLGFTGGTGYTLSSGDGFLSLNYDIPSTSSSIVVNPSIYTNFYIDGDYTADVTVNFSGIPVDNGDGSGSPAFVAHDGLNDFNVISADTIAAGSFVAGFQSLSGIGATTGFAFTSDNVKLQFQRIGKTLIESYAPAGSTSFQVLTTTTDSSYGGPASFTLSSYYSGTDGIVGVIKFSDFSIDTPSPSSVPECATWAMMICGLGAIGGLTRGSRRKSEEGGKRLLVFA